MIYRVTLFNLLTCRQIIIYIFNCFYQVNLSLKFFILHDFSSNVFLCAQLNNILSGPMVFINSAACWSALINHHTTLQLHLQPLTQFMFFSSLLAFRPCPLSPALRRVINHDVCSICCANVLLGVELLSSAFFRTLGWVVYQEKCYCCCLSK